MWHDPIIAEIHKTREQIALAYGNDIHAICEAARRGELSNPVLAEPAINTQQSPRIDRSVSASPQ